MQPLYYFAFTFLCSLSFPSSLHSIQCNETQYPRSLDGSQFCCNMCPPGNYLVKRFGRCQTECKACGGKRYRHTYNVELSCDFCENCDRPNMEYVSHCNATHNAVCRCKAGYECKDQPCKECLLIPPTTKVTLPPFSTALKPGTRTEFWTLKDKMWFLVIITLLVAGIVVSVAKKNSSSILRWIRSKYGYLLAKSHPPVLPCSEDEEVSKPVQEAGNATNLNRDPELGLAKISQMHF